jgi:predicted nuclease with RNAse H fold
MDVNKNVHYLGKWWEFNDILKLFYEISGNIVQIGIDGPLQPPYELDLCCFSGNSQSCAHFQTTTYKGRYCEYLLMKNGFRCYMTSKNSFAKNWILRCFELNQFLTSYSFQTIEVFPSATQKISFPQLKGKKQLKSSRESLEASLRKWGITFPELSSLYTHDELDSVLAAVTVLLYHKKGVIALGDDRDGHIYIPKR